MVYRYIYSRQAMNKRWLGKSEQKMTNLFPLVPCFWTWWAEKPAGIMDHWWLCGGRPRRTRYEAVRREAERRTDWRSEREKGSNLKPAPCLLVQVPVHLGSIHSVSEPLFWLYLGFYSWGPSRVSPVQKCQYLILKMSHYPQHHQRTRPWLSLFAVYCPLTLHHRQRCAGRLTTARGDDTFRGRYRIM